jgi:thiol-disulfide isomerase/thioredoxin
VLFFHAPWCPTCRAAEKDVLARTADLPAGLVIVKVDYDGATELKQRYGVTRQSTFVQVDGEGRELARFADATSVDAILARLV